MSDNIARTRRVGAEESREGIFYPISEVFEGMPASIGASFLLQRPRQDDDITGQGVSALALLDLETLNAEDFDPDVFIRDCEILSGLARSNPDDMRRILSAALDDPRAAYSYLEKLELTEEQIIRRGGGMMMLFILAGAFLFAGCATRSGADRVITPAIMRGSRRDGPDGGQ